MRTSIGQAAGRHYANPVVCALVILLSSCAASQPEIESIVSAELERRSWPATSVLVVERGAVRLNLGHRTPPARDPTAHAIDLARVMARFPLQFEPGSRFSYSNTAYHAAARIVERRTGLAYDAFLTRDRHARQRRRRVGRHDRTSHRRDAARRRSTACDRWRTTFHARWSIRRRPIRGDGRNARRVVAPGDAADGGCPAIRLHMAGMEWPGRRVLR